MTLPGQESSIWPNLRFARVDDNAKAVPYPRLAVRKLLGISPLMKGSHMRRIILALAIAAGILLLSIVVADACGDKALRIGRGIRFQRPSHPVAVLIYFPSNTTRATQLQSMLKKVGHKSYAAQGVDSLSEALRSGQYDLVFADLAEAATLEKQIGTSPSKPVLVPVVSKGTKAEVSAAQKQYRYVVKNPHSADHYLDAIEDAMRSRVHLLAKKS